VKKPRNRALPGLKTTQAMTRRSFLAVTTTAMAGALLAACTPPAPAAKPAPPPSKAEPGAAPPAKAEAPAAAPAAKKGLKSLTIGTTGSTFNQVGNMGRTNNELNFMLQAALTTQNPMTLRQEPWMAEELPSKEKGTWKIEPDGTMVATWRLRPGITWHDGTPFSSKDFVFGWQVETDPKVPIANVRIQNMVSKMETPDDRTLVMYWKNPFNVHRSLTRMFFPLPRHILQSVYESDPTRKALNESPYWTTKFVGTGPFKLVDWGNAQQVVFEAHDTYFWGRPKIDRVVWRVIPDQNTLLTAVLSDEVDVTMRTGLSFEGGLVAKREWEAKGKGTAHMTPASWRWINPAAENPVFGWNAPNQNKMRQALLQAINREEMVKEVMAGQVEVIHIPLSPGRPFFQNALSGAKRFPYDPSRAQQLMAEAGWTKGPDGILANNRGEKLSVDFRASSDIQQDLQYQAIAAAGWKAIGVDVKINNLPDRVIDDRDNRGRWPGLRLGGHNLVVEDWPERFLSENIPNDQNQWARENVSRWANPAKDKILNDLDRATDISQIDALSVEYCKLFTEDLPHLPLTYTVDTTTVRKPVTGVDVRYESGGDNARNWHIERWDIG
jgi:peptide/nickel transport system substrate-binding protein